MAWVAIGVASAVAPAIYKGIKGISQSNQANNMHPINPGYRVNQSVIDNARTLSDQYGNYQLPGYSQMAGNINTNFQDAFDSGKQGATSGADIMDLATRVAYGKNQAFNQLGEENAQGKQSLLGSYLNANAAAGQEYQNKNAYDRDQYNAQLKEKAALTQAGAQNEFGAIDQLASVGSKFAFSAAKKNGTDTIGMDNTNNDQISDAYKKWFDFSTRNGSGSMIGPTN
jgi:hypothetical protein